MAFKPLGVAGTVAEEPQPPAGADPRVELPHAAGDGVAGILQYLGPFAAFDFRLLRLVELHEVGVGHVDFAANFQERQDLISPLLLGEGPGVRAAAFSLAACPHPNPLPKGEGT